jgi:hypothetical protein
MDTPFRNDADALRTRLTSLDEEIAALRTRTREYETARARLAQLEGEQADVRRELDARTRRPAPLLDGLRVASPCHERWDDMLGDERTRHCLRCNKDVHNVSEMTRDEAEAFLASVSSSVCVRMYRRADGTVLTADCPVGVQKKRVKRLFLATIGGGLAAAAGAVAFWQYETMAVMGGMPARTDHPATMGTAMPVPADTAAPGFATPPDRAEIVGAGHFPEQQNPAKTPQKSPSSKLAR